MGKLRPFVRKDSYMPNKKWIPFVIGNGYTTVDGASGPAPEWDTAIGNPVSFNALTPWPLRQLKVAFSPVQSLNGYDSPWPAGGGKNKFDVSKIENHTDTYGGTISQSNGTLSITTSTGSSNVRCGKTLGQLAPLLTVGETYIITGDSTATSAKQIYLPAVSTLWKFGDPLTITQEALNSEVAFYASGTNASATITQVMIRLSSVSDGTFAPYSNLCPISGWSSLTVEQTGTNLLPSNREVYSKNTSYTFIPAIMPPNTLANMSFTDKDTSVDISGCYLGFVKDYKGSGSPTSYRWVINNGVVQSEKRNIAGAGDYGANCQGVFIYPATDETFNKLFSRYNIQVELGESASEYVPYNPSSRSISISLGETVYSGYVDVVTGVVTVTHGFTTIDGNSTVNPNGSTENTSRFITAISGKANGVSNFTSNLFYYAAVGDAVGIATGRASNNLIEFMLPASVTQTANAGKAWFADNPTQVCYELAEPLTIQLTPQEVESLLGDNVLFSDANGDLTVTYRSN